MGFKLRARSGRRERIMICVPTVAASISLGIFKFLHACERANADNSVPYRFEHAVCNKKEPVEYARNYLCGQFLNSDCERLWFLDEDMQPDVNAIDLLRVDADIVAGRAFIWDHKNKDHSAGLRPSVFRYNELGDNRFTHILPPSGTTIVDCDAVGTATMVIRRAVLEDPRMRLNSKYISIDNEPHDLEDEVGHEDYAPAIFRTPRKPNGEALRGEDFDFCLRAKACGYSIKAHMGIGFGHMKRVDLEHVAEFVGAASDRIVAASAA